MPILAIRTAPKYCPSRWHAHMISVAIPHYLKIQSSFSKSVRLVAAREAIHLSEMSPFRPLSPAWASDYCPPCFG
jgi:hypothetical protein